MKINLKHDKKKIYIADHKVSAIVPVTDCFYYLFNYIYKWRNPPLSQFGFFVIYPSASSDILLESNTS